MTTTHFERTADDSLFVVTEVDGIPMSGRLAQAPDPRATLVALHGGSTSSAYFDCPGHPELSLLRIAAPAGFTVLALDRPGFGSSGERAAELTDPQRRVDLMFGAIDAHLGARPRGAGVFLAAHSAGSYLALHMAADDRGRQLLGLELAGYGIDPTSEADRTFQAATSDTPVRLRRDGAPAGVAELLWHPAHLYPADMVGGARIGAYGPRYEADPAENWAEVTFPRLTSRVRVPVRLTVGDRERVWRNTPEDLAKLAAHFTAAPRMVLNVQPSSGHNLSVGRTAAAYHLKLLSFVAECAVSREVDRFDSATTQLDGAPYSTTG
jgi:pimeloyl-ACP methyl ester carboxylesterase